MKYRWILFDADGTLFDYDTAEHSALRKTVEEYGYEGTPELHWIYRTINSGLFSELEEGKISSEELRVKRFQVLFSQFGYEIEIDAFSRRYLTNMSRASELLPGAMETVRALQSRCKLIIVTNGISEVQRSRFEATALQSYFADIVISDEVGVSKPSKEIFDIAFERMNMPAKRETMIVGDSLTSDMAGGINYGIDTCWYNPSCIQNDLDLEVTHEIRSLQQLTSLV